MAVDKGIDNTDREAEELAISNETDKARVRRVAEAWGVTLSTPQGRAVMWDIIQRSGMFDEVPYGATDFVMRAIGKAGNGRALYDEIKAGYPRRFLEMVQENM